MKGSFEKFHDWLYKWLFERNEKVQGIKLKYDLPMDPKQQVWTTVKENENGSKIRFKHKVTEKTHYSCGTCFILTVMALMAIIVVVFVTMSDNLFYDQPLKSKFFSLELKIQIIKSMIENASYRKVASTCLSLLKAHVGFFRFSMLGIFDVYLL